jgi:hypothetical protein
MLFESGVRYSNQTGGYSCWHPEVEGVYVPLFNELIDQEAELTAYFTGPKWGGWCSDGIDEETADLIDSVLQKSSYTKRITVDRSRLADSHEAWVYVLLSPSDEDVDFEEIHGFPGNQAVLTWDNSD